MGSIHPNLTEHNSTELNLKKLVFLLQKSNRNFPGFSFNNHIFVIFFFFLGFSFCRYTYLLVLICFYIFFSHNFCILCTYMKIYIELRCHCHLVFLNAFSRDSRCFLERVSRLADFRPTVRGVNIVRAPPCKECCKNPYACSCFRRIQPYTHEPCRGVTWNESICTKECRRKQARTGTTVVGVGY